MFSRRTLSSADFEQLGVFAAQASVAIKNAYLFAEAALTRRLEAENAYLKEEPTRRGRQASSASAAMAHVLRELQRVAPTTSTVLLLARPARERSLRASAPRDEPTARRPDGEAQLRRHQPCARRERLSGTKGAFTGALASHRAVRARRRRDPLSGRDRRASARRASKLLRVLQEQEFERVGGTHSLRVDVRIVVATNRDLAAEVRAHRFRADLYFRLNVFPIAIPPLRDRREDVPLLANAFLHALADRLGAEPKGIDDRALAALARYDWPGNVRELQNVIERAAILARGRRIHASDLTLPEAPRAGARPRRRARTRAAR